MQTCMKNERAAAIIGIQIQEAAAAGITATPTLQLLDGETERSLKLEGAVSNDVLLSALDWLSSAPLENSEETSLPRMPADDVGDISK